MGPTRADEVEEEDGEGEREEETGSDGACSCGGCGGDRDNNISRLTFAPPAAHQCSALIIISSALLNTKAQQSTLESSAGSRCQSLVIRAFNRLSPVERILCLTKQPHTQLTNLIQYKNGR